MVGVFEESEGTPKESYGHCRKNHESSRESVEKQQCGQRNFWRKPKRLIRKPTEAKMIAICCFFCFLFFIFLIITLCHDCIFVHMLHLCDLNFFSIVYHAYIHVSLHFLYITSYSCNQIAQYYNVCRLFPNTNKTLINY